VLERQCLKPKLGAFASGVASGVAWVPSDSRWPSVTLVRPNTKK
jgi:hypothetical protein